MKSTQQSQLSSKRLSTPFSKKRKKAKSKKSMTAKDSSSHRGPSAHASSKGPSRKTKRRNYPSTSTSYAGVRRTSLTNRRLPQEQREHFYPLAHRQNPFDPSYSALRTSYPQREEDFYDQDPRRERSSWHQKNQRSHRKSRQKSPETHSRGPTESRTRSARAQRAREREQERFHPSGSSIRYKSYPIEERDLDDDFRDVFSSNFEQDSSRFQPLHRDKTSDSYFINEDDEYETYEPARFSPRFASEAESWEEDLDLDDAYEYHAPEDDETEEDYEEDYEDPRHSHSEREDEFRGSPRVSTGRHPESEWRSSEHRHKDSRHKPRRRGSASKSRHRPHHSSRFHR